jgi:hypothetical protein
MAMRWQELLFIHWPVRRALLRPLIPAALEIDTFDGTAWIGVVPFRMTGVRPHYMPALPGLSAFPELNVRTYVHAQGKPGVWFFSLDAANPVAVRLARWRFHLPYFDARMTIVPDQGGWRYRSTRTHRGAPRADFSGWYRPVGPVYQAAAGSLDHWLTARYCFYAADIHNRLWRCEIDHVPWPLQPAEADIATNTLLAPLGGERFDRTPLLHVAQRLDVVAWGLTRVS